MRNCHSEFSLKLAPFPSPLEWQIFKKTIFSFIILIICNVFIRTVSSFVYYSFLIKNLSLKITAAVKTNCVHRPHSIPLNRSISIGIKESQIHPVGNTSFLGSIEARLVTLFLVSSVSVVSMPDITNCM